MQRMRLAQGRFQLGCHVVRHGQAARVRMESRNRWISQQKPEQAARRVASVLQTVIYCAMIALSRHPDAGVVLAQRLIAKIIGRQWGVWLRTPGLLRR